MFLQIGLIVALLVSLLAFEWKSYEKSGSDLGSMEMSLEDEDIIPITQREIKPPPPPPPPPEVIQIVEDDVETAPSNLAFDESLKARDPAWGLRDVADLDALAEARNLHRTARHEMPANNLVLVYRRN